MYKVVKYLLLITLTFSAFSCANKSKQQDIDKNDAIKYAKGFDICKTDKSYTKLTVFNPWNDYKSHSIYYLVKDESSVTPTDGIKIKIPVSRVVINSATYLGFMELLDELGCIDGVCNSDYIYNKTILEGVKEGKIQDLGNSFDLDIERLLLLKPDVIFTTAYNGDQKEADLFDRYQLKPVFNIEWQEPSLLGRAEWIKFIAAFFDKEEVANQLFNEIEQNFVEAKFIAEQAKTTPSILSGQDFRGSWSMPAGTSYAAQLFKAAKASYHYSDDTQFHGSIPVTIEEALVYFNNADFWVNTQANTYDELLEHNAKYKLFKAFQVKQVFNNNNRANATGGNDYWEMGVAKPDLILKDLIKAIHPELLKDYQFTFMKPLI